MSTSKSGSAKATGGKGRPTPKRNANTKKSKVQQSRSANRQWYIIAAVIVLIVATIFVLTTVFGEPYEPIRNQQLEAIR